MRKIILVIMMFLTFTVFGSSLNVSSQSGGNINLLFNLNKTKLLFTVTQNNEGRIKLSSSPVISYSNSKLQIGELKFTNWEIQSISTPSSNPKYSGLALKLDQATVFVSNPIFCPASDKAVGFVYENYSSSFGLLFDIDNKEDPALGYQIDWSSRKQRRLSPMFAFEFTASLLNHKAMLEASYDNDESYKLSIFKNNVMLSYSRTLKESQSHEIELASNGFMSTKFTIEKEPESQYSGRSQSGQITFENSLCLYNTSLTVVSDNSYKEDSSKIKTTGFLLKYENSSFTFKVGTVLNRTENSEQGLTFPEVEFTSDNVTFEIKNKKTYLTLKFSEKIGSLKVSFSLSQNKSYSIGFALD